MALKKLVQSGIVSFQKFSSQFSVISFLLHDAANLLTRDHREAVANSPPLKQNKKLHLEKSPTNFVLCLSARQYCCSEPGQLTTEN
jgi:hypothetical protein